MHNLIVVSHLCQEATYFNKVGEGIAVHVESNYKIPRIRKFIQTHWMGVTQSQDVHPAGGTEENATNGFFVVRPPAGRQDERTSSELLNCSKHLRHSCVRMTQIWQVSISPWKWAFLETSGKLLV